MLILDEDSHVCAKLHVLLELDRHHLCYSSLLLTPIFVLAMDDNSPPVPSLDDQEESVRIAVKALGDMRNSGARPDSKLGLNRSLSEISI